MQSIALHQDGAVRVHVANSAKDTQEVETNHCAAVTKPIDDTLEELRFGEADGNWGGDTTNFEEWVEEVLKGVGFREYETPEQRLERFGSDQLIFNLGSFILQPRTTLVVLQHVMHTKSLLP